MCIMEAIKSVENATAFYDKNDENERKMSTLIEGFLEYAQYELNFSIKTIVKYRESLGWFIRDVGDMEVDKLDVRDFVRLKRMMIDRCQVPILLDTVSAIKN